jgi:hypothetical protein
MTCNITIWSYGSVDHSSPGGLARFQSDGGPRQSSPSPSSRTSTQRSTHSSHFRVGGFGDASKSGGKASAGVERGLEPGAGGGVVLGDQPLAAGAFVLSSRVVRGGKRIRAATPPMSIAARTSPMRSSSGKTGQPTRETTGPCLIVSVSGEREADGAVLGLANATCCASTRLEWLAWERGRGTRPRRGAGRLLRRGPVVGGRFLAGVRRRAVVVGLVVTGP